MSFTASVFFSLSISIAAILGGVRFRKINPAFLPFLVYLWVGLANEGLSVLLINRGYSNLINYNLFVLAEVLVIGYQFFRWKLLTAPHWTAYAFFAASWWGAESWLRSGQDFNSYFVIGFSFLLVLISIGAVNKLLFRDTSTLVKNPVFLICIGFILYFSFSALTETFWQFGGQQSASFRVHVSNLFNYVNLFTNLLYAFAVLWMPMRRDFILPC